MEISIRATASREAELAYYVKKYKFSLQPSAAKYELLLNSDGLELIQKDSQTKPLKVDFYSSSIKKRLKNLNSELLLKAIGKKNRNQNIVDATAGLAQDAFLMAAAGHKVTLIEKSNIVAALLESAIKRGLPTQKHMNLLYGDAINLLSKIKPKPEIVYLDPMYPKTGKTAAQKKGMQFFRDILTQTSQHDSEEMLQASLETATKRVIVKRPIKASNLTKQKPSASIRGKTTRFDIYII